jgi:hypothetical protein
MKKPKNMSLKTAERKYERSEADKKADLKGAKKLMKKANERKAKK